MRPLSIVSPPPRPGGTRGSSSGSADIYFLYILRYFARKYVIILKTLLSRNVCKFMHGSYECMQISILMCAGIQQQASAVTTAANRADY